MDFIQHYLYWYLIYPHPMYWLYQRALEYNAVDFEKGIWFAIAIFGIALWIGIARFFAETPGRLYGNTYLWWILIVLIHVWVIPIYIAYVLIGGMVRNRREAIKERDLSDRPKSEIYADAWKEKRAAQAARAQSANGSKKNFPRIR